MQGVDMIKLKDEFETIVQKFEDEQKGWGHSNADYKGDDVDLFNEEKELSLDLKLKKRNLFYIKKIKQALARMEEGTFGDCKDCGDEIGISRLLARPTASLCIKCKEEQEKTEGQLAGRVTHPSVKKEKSVINLDKFRMKSKSIEFGKTVNS